MSADRDSSNDEVDSNVEIEARNMGWVPKEDFRGDVSKWKDADTFVKDGKHIMPILRKNNETLLQGQQALRQQVELLSRQLEAAKGDFETLQQFHNEEVARRSVEVKRDLLAKLRAAKSDGDVDSEVELTDQLSQLNAATKAVKDSIEGAEEAEDTPDARMQAAVNDPIFVAWRQANPWLDQDQALTHKAMAAAYEIKREQPNLVGGAFFAELDRRLAGGSGRPKPGKVEESRGGSSVNNSSGRSYADLPADVKVVCDKFARQFVNPDGRFKTEGDYRRHYVKQLEDQGYFNQ